MVKNKCFVGLCILCLLLGCVVPVYGEGLDSLDSVVGVVDKNSEILTYRNIIEKIVHTLNKRDSYYYELRNPEDSIKYVEELGVALPRDLNKQITRIEFVSLLNEITEKMTKNKHYETDLVDILSIFSDIDRLSEKEIKDIEIVFIEGILTGVSEGKFEPYSNLTLEQFNMAMENILNGYSRKNLFELVDSCYTEEERNIALNGEEDRGVNYDDFSSLLPKLHKEGIELEVIGVDKSKPLTIKDFLMCLNVYWSGNLFKFDEDNYYVGKDNIFISDEEWEYFCYNLGRGILYSEAKILYERALKLKEDAKKIAIISDFKEILYVSENYLPIYDLVVEMEDCFNFFMDLNQSVYVINGGDFPRSVHECQHEVSAKLSNRYSYRTKNDTEWAIYWHSRPTTFYYLDITNGSWVDSKNLSRYPKTKSLYSSYADNLKDMPLIKSYASTTDYISNIWGIQGILQEFSSYGIHCKVEILSYSLGINEATLARIDFKNYLSMQYMVKNYIENLEQNKNKYKSGSQSLHDIFMDDTDVVRMINNTFKEMDFYYEVYGEKLERWPDIAVFNTYEIPEIYLELEVPEHSIY